MCSFHILLNLPKLWSRKWFSRKSTKKWIILITQSNRRLQNYTIDIMWHISVLSHWCQKVCKCNIWAFRWMFRAFRLYFGLFWCRKLGRNALECYNFCVFNLSFSLDPTIKLEELQNSFPELPSWIAQQYLTQFEQQVFSIFQNSYKNFTILHRKLTFFAKNYHFSL